MTGAEGGDSMSVLSHASPTQVKPWTSPVSSPSQIISDKSTCGAGIAGGLIHSLKMMSQEMMMDCVFGSQS